MNRPVRGLLFAAALLSATPAWAQEPPNAWFVQGARDTMSFFASPSPPASTPPGTVLFTWVWRIPPPPVDPYPNAVPVTRVTYGGEEDPEELPWHWTVRADSFPEIAIGPGGELWLASTNPDSAKLEQWSEFLDAAEGALRQGRARPEPEIGRWGDCQIASEHLLATVAEPADVPLMRSDPSPGLGPRIASVRVLRSVRWLVNGCRPSPTDTLRLFLISANAHAIVVPAAKFHTVPAIALGSLNTPLGPSVRLLEKKDAGLELRLQRVAPGDSLELCGLRAFVEACQRDRSYRRRLYTVLGPGGWAAAVQQGCIAAFREHREATRICTTIAGWKSHAGGISHGYEGSLLLSKTPRIESRVTNDSVQWVLFSPPTGAETTDSIKLTFPGDTAVLATLMLGDPGILQWLLKLWPIVVLVLVVLVGALLYRNRARMRVPRGLSSAIAAGRLKVTRLWNKDSISSTKKEEPDDPDTHTEPKPPVLPPPPPKRAGAARPRKRVLIRYIGDARIAKAAAARAEAVAREALEAEHGAWLEQAKKDMIGILEAAQNTLLKKEEEHKAELKKRRDELEQDLSDKLPALAEKQVETAAVPVRKDLEAQAIRVLGEKADDHIEKRWKPYEDQLTTLQHLLRDPQALAKVERLYASLSGELALLEQLLALLDRMPERKHQLEAMGRMLEDPAALARVERLYATLRSEPRLLEDGLLLLDRLPDEDVLMLLDPTYRREAAGVAEEAEARRKYQQLAAELARPGHEPLFRLFSAGDQLGHWIERHVEILAEVAGGPRSKLREIRSRLPEPAAKDFERARVAAQRFAREDVNVFRRILDFTTEKYRQVPGPVKRGEGVLLDRWGLLTGDRPLRDRLRDYLEPPDRPGRLSEVAQALQYLFEALPVEHLSHDERTRLHEQLQPGADTDGAYEFHALLQEMALGVGLRYQPLSYYRSSANQNPHVREEVTAISLSDLVGRAAGTSRPLTIVRTERPFFFDAQTGIYYAGHAYVAQ